MDGVKMTSCKKRDLHILFKFCSFNREYKIARFSVRRQNYNVAMFILHRFCEMVWLVLDNLCKCIALSPNKVKNSNSPVTAGNFYEIKNVISISISDDIPTCAWRVASMALCATILRFTRMAEQQPVRTWQSHRSNAVLYFAHSFRMSSFHL